MTTRSLAEKLAKRSKHVVPTEDEISEIETMIQSAVDERVSATSTTAIDDRIVELIQNGTLYVTGGGGLVFEGRAAE